jgi:hypothetical protein
MFRRELFATGLDKRAASIYIPCVEHMHSIHGTPEPATARLIDGDRNDQSIDSFRPVICETCQAWECRCPPAEVAQSMHTPEVFDKVSESDNGCCDNRKSSSFNGIPGTRSKTGALLTMAELAVSRPRCAVCQSIIRSNVIHRKRNRHFCSRAHYFAFRRADRTYLQNRAGQRYARIVVERHYGPLPVGSVVHHFDGNNLNNDPANLALLPSHSEHLRLHHELPAQVLWDGRSLKSEAA